MQWALRLIAVMIVAGVADGLIVLLVPRPLPWAALLPSLVPLATVVFVIMPMQKSRKPPQAP